MLKNHWRIISKIERACDNLIVVLAFLLSYHLRDVLFALGASFELPVLDSLPALGRIENYVIILGFALPIYNALLSLFGAYRSMRLLSSVALFRLIGIVSILAFLSQGALFYLLKLDFSRSFVTIFIILSGVGLFLERIIILRVLRFFRVRGRNFRNILIVGTGNVARTIYMELIKQPELGLRVAGFVNLSSPNPKTGSDKNNFQGNLALSRADIQSAVYDLPARIVADIDTFEVALKRLAIDEVLFSDVLENFSVVKNLAQIAVEEGVRVSLAADLFSLEIFKSELSYFGSIPLIHYHPSPGGADSTALVVKRLIDISVSLLLLILVSPILVITALAIKLDSRGPVFFRQRRVGLNGRTFVLLKFRSMVDEAEKLLPNLLEHNEMVGPVFKIKADPRITKVGRFIRRYSIDELPQLINVLRGDMSLVGPRPPLPNEVAYYMRKQRKRLSMRPGLTCTWQVSGRNNIPDFTKWAELDLEYIDNWSLATDIKLLLKTIPAVLGAQGAR